jgi:hypothetical protein
MKVHERVMEAFYGEAGHGPRHNGEIPSECTYVGEGRGSGPFVTFVDMETGVGDLLYGELEPELLDRRRFQAKELMEPA